MIFRNYLLIMSILVFLGCDQMPENEKLKKEKVVLLEQISKMKADVQTIDARLMAIDSVFRKEQKKATPVTLLDLTRQIFKHKIETRATIESKSNVMVSAKVGGQVRRILVREGQSVKKGQLLVMLDAAILNHSIAEVKKQLEFATTVFEKRSKLWLDNKVGSEIDYLNAKTNKEGLDKKLSTLKSQKDQFRVYAPFSGIVEDVPVKVGQMAVPGYAVIQIVNTSDLYVKSDLSEAFIGLFDKSSQATISFPNQADVFQTKVLSIGQVVNAVNRTFTLEAAVPTMDKDYTLKPNQVCVLSLVDYINPDVFVLPTKIIFEDKGGTFVYAVKKDNDKMKVYKVPIGIGRTYNAHTEVLSGLTGTEKIVDRGYRDMSEGLLVTVSHKSI